MQHKCFTVKFMKFLTTLSLQGTSIGSETRDVCEVIFIKLRAFSQRF